MLTGSTIVYNDFEHIVTWASATFNVYSVHGLQNIECFTCNDINTLEQACTQAENWMYQYYSDTYHNNNVL